MVPKTVFYRETIVGFFFCSGSPMGGRLGSRDGGGSSTGGSSWDGGSVTGGRLRSGSLIGVFLRLLMGVPRGPIAQDFKQMLHRLH